MLTTEEALNKAVKEGLITTARKSAIQSNLEAGAKAEN